MMKKLLIFLFCSILITGCREQQKQIGPTLTVTIEPLRYFTETIVGDKFNVVSMVPDGTSPETYDPTPQQLVNLSKTTAYLQIGHIGFEQTWIQKLQKNMPKLPFYDTSKGINLIHATHVHSHDNHTGIEPHTWNSTQNAHIIAQNIYKAVSEIDPQNATYYKHRLDSLSNIIDDTDVEVQKLLIDADKTFMIYHPALTYFARDYGLNQISIEEAGKEPSPSHIQGLIKTCKQNGTRIIFVQKEFDMHNAQMIAKEIGVKIIPINPLSYDWRNEMIQIAKALNNASADKTNIKEESNSIKN